MIHVDAAMDIEEGEFAGFRKYQSEADTFVPQDFSDWIVTTFGFTGRVEQRVGMRLIRLAKDAGFKVFWDPNLPSIIFAARPEQIG